MTASRMECSAAPVHRDRHMTMDRQWHVTDPDGALYVFCSGCCLLTFAVRGALPQDVQNTVETSAREAA
jgi:hypothetical protein